MNAIPTNFPIVRDMHELKRATSDALVAQYKVGWAECARTMRLRYTALMAVFCPACFVGGAVFAAALTYLVVGSLP